MPAREQFPALTWNGVTFWDVPETAAVLDLRAGAAVGVPGNRIIASPNTPYAPAGNWLWNAYRYGFDAFGAAVRYEGRILGMDGFVVVPAALATPSLHYALWELERLEVDEGGTAGTFPLEKPTLADGRDATAGTAYRPAHLLGTEPIMYPLRPNPSRSPRSTSCGGPS